LTARLRVSSNGQVQTAGEVRYAWDQWDKDQPAATGRLVYLVQDGAPFGQKGKRLQQLALDVKGSPGFVRSYTHSPVVLDIKGGGMSSTLSGMAKGIVFHDVYLPTPGLGKVEMTLPSLNAAEFAQASRGGQTHIALDVDWQGQ
jgi:hypothetical protein